MKINIIRVDQCPDHEKDAFYEGFRFVCQCGEQHRTRAGAEICRKCRTYLADLPTEVTEIIL